MTCSKPMSCRSGLDPGLAPTATGSEVSWLSAGQSIVRAVISCGTANGATIFERDARWQYHHSISPSAAAPTSPLPIPTTRDSAKLERGKSGAEPERGSGLRLESAFVLPPPPPPPALLSVMVPLPLLALPCSLLLRVTEGLVVCVEVTRSEGVCVGDVVEVGRTVGVGLAVELRVSTEVEVAGAVPLREAVGLGLSGGVKEREGEEDGVALENCSWE